MDAPASRNALKSPNAPVPVALIAATFIPDRVKPWARLATAVVLPPFIDVPTTTM